MFRELNAIHGNERPGKLQNLGQNCNLSKKGPKRHGLRRFEAKEEIKGN